MKEIMNLIHALEDVDNMEKEVTTEKYSYTLKKKNGTITLEAYTNDEFDDSDILKSISDFNSFIGELDDDIFQEAAKRIGEKTNLKRLDDLLEMEHLTREEAEEAEEAIATACSEICGLLTDKIKDILP